jgi:hypothetical protein
MGFLARIVSTPLVVIAFMRFWQSGPDESGYCEPWCHMAGRDYAWVCSYVRQNVGRGHGLRRVAGVDVRAASGGCRVAGVVGWLSLKEFSLSRGCLVFSAVSSRSSLRTPHAKAVKLCFL